MTRTRPLRSASKSSPASGKSTPRARATRNSGADNKGKTSPYFSKTASSPLAKGRAATNGSNGKNAKKERKTEVEYDSATGLTETEDEDESDEEDVPTEDEFDPNSGAEGASDAEVDSDEIDEPSDPDEDEESEEEDTKRGKGKSKKRKSTAAVVTAGSGKKPKWKQDEEEGYGDIELEEGQEIAGRIYPAPTNGQGKSPAFPTADNTFDFLANLQIPEKNDRDWFKSHEPSFRQAEKEWKDFVGLVQEKFHEADDEIPILPPKDIIHRIYRDVRFSSDKTPYKKNFSMSTSRGGRKGIWAGYHLNISPNGNSLIAAGVWQPDKNEVSNIRHSITNDPKGFRDIIGAPAFVKLFGPAKEHPKGKRQNIFGHDDALKYAPKGVDKAHKDIDLLKLRSVAVVHHDQDVLAKNFRDKVKDVVAVMMPFVHKLNDMIALPTEDDEDEDGDDAEEEEAGEDDED